MCNCSSRLLHVLRAPTLVPHASCCMYRIRHANCRVEPAPFMSPSSAASRPPMLDASQSLLHCAHMRQPCFVESTPRRSTGAGTTASSPHHFFLHLLPCVHAPSMLSSVTGVCRTAHLATHCLQCRQGTAIKKGQELRLQHVATRRWLHSHLFASPLSNNQEVRAWRGRRCVNTGELYSQGSGR